MSGKESYKAAVFLDTNTLIAAAKADPSLLSDGEGRRLLEIARLVPILVGLPEIVVEEYIHWLCGECDSRLGGLDWLRNVGLDVPCINVPADKALHIRMWFSSQISESGVVRCSTPPVEVAELVEASVKHIPPFVERDKGFRDTLILLSIIDVARRERIPHLILVTRDKVFQRAQIAKRVKSETGAELTVCETVHDAVTNAQPFLEAAEKEEMARRDLEAERICKEHFAQLRTYALDNIVLPGELVATITASVDPRFDGMLDDYDITSFSSAFAGLPNAQGQCHLTCYLVLILKCCGFSVRHTSPVYGYGPQGEVLVAGAKLGAGALVKIDALAQENPDGKFDDLQPVSTAVEPIPIEGPLIRPEPP